MPEVIYTTVYQFPELSEGAKEKARSWYRGLGPNDDWWDAVYEDFERVCEILGIRLKTRAVRLTGGGARAKPCIWFLGSAAKAMARRSRATSATPRVRQSAFVTMPRRI